MTEKHSAEPGLFRRILRRTAILTGTGLAIALSFGLVTVGADMIAARAADTSTAPERPATPVAASPLELQAAYEVSSKFTGPIEPARNTDLGFELGGTLAEILVDEGDEVEEGQTLARLDVRALQADRTAQQAAIEAAIARRDIAQLTADRQSELAAREFASPQRRDEATFNLAVAQADIARAEAALTAIDVALAKSEIVAPYSGIVRARLVDEGARLGPNQTLLVLQDTLVQMRVGVPEDLSNRFSTGDTVDVELPSGVVTGRVARLRPDLDPATRTRGVLIELPTSVSPVTGTLAEVTLTRTVPVQGAWVPLGALSEGIDGLWTVFVLPDDVSELQRVAVTLEHVALDNAYVAGAFPENAHVVTGGTHRLSPGQTATLAVGG
ncbi:MAG: efflux RND transporter periplasmic adaptor subunit [Pseudomonadota bacterium]